MHVEKLKRPAFLCTWKFKYCFEHTFILIISCIVYRIAHGEAVGLHKFSFSCWFSAYVSS